MRRSHPPRPLATRAGALVMVGAAVAGCASGGGGPDAPGSRAASRDVPAVAADPADVSTLDGIVRAYYEVVSRPAGVPTDRERDRSLHHPDALVVLVGRDAAGNPVPRSMTLDAYHDASGAPSDQGFFEWEIHRATQRFGSVAHVWSTYAWSAERMGGPVGGRGINSIELFWDGARWWITSWSFDSETPGRPIPAEYLPG